MTIKPFTSDRALAKFAKSFLRDRLSAFRKDVGICLTRSSRRDHAYFPALITCISFADFLSGLHAGKLDGHGLKELRAYAAKFLDNAKYDPYRIGVLYECLRHKVAHLGQPYIVFDTATKPKTLSGQRRRITWTVYASKRKPPIELIDYPKPLFMKKTKTPWRVSYDCRIQISVRSLAADIGKSIYGPKGYLGYLQTDKSARERFAKCMVHYFPPA
jgi:hypothetical protein